MNKKTVWLEAQQRNFVITPNGVQWEAVIFSSEFNRNSSYFDIYKLLRWRNKLEKVLLNNSHDGKYFPILLDKITKIEVKTDDYGVTECYAVVESTNQEKIANPEMVTGFSIELRVRSQDVIANENGEYYIDFEWVGMAYLLGELAGSGDTRLLSMKTFNQKNNKNNNMELEQLQKNLEKTFTEKLEEATKNIAEKLSGEHLEQLQKSFSDQLKNFEEEVLNKQASKTVGSFSWVGEDGETYTETWESIYKSIVTKTPKPTLADVVEYMLDLLPEDEKNLIKVENQLKNIKETEESKFSANSKSDTGVGAVTTVQPKTYSGFIDSIRKSLK